jgi:UDP-N-acetylglucosamine 4,6-dehydratase (inverting)
MIKTSYSFFNKKTILITGGTGSFGNAFVKNVLKKSDPKKIIIFSRDEMKQWMMHDKLRKKNLKFIIGDVRDRQALDDVFSNHKIDFVVHAAATKIVPTAELNPEECIKTNIYGAINVIKACIANKVKKVVALSTDKASNPINLYGATKLCSDKLFSSQINNEIKTLFSIVRYGNVIGSRGSVIPFFLSLSDGESLPITHKEMTRFFLNLNEAVDFVYFAFKKMIGGEIFVRKLDSINILKLAKIIKPKNKIKFIGIRDGEKIHEQMIGRDESELTVEFKNHYEILPNLSIKNKKIKIGGKQVSKNFYYGSDNTNKINVSFLKKEIENIKKDQKL